MRDARVLASWAVGPAKSASTVEGHSASPAIDGTGRGTVRGRGQAARPPIGGRPVKPVSSASGARPRAERLPGPPPRRRARPDRRARPARHLHRPPRRGVRPARHPAGGLEDASGRRADRAFTGTRPSPTPESAARLRTIPPSALSAATARLRRSAPGGGPGCAATQCRPPPWLGPAQPADASRGSSPSPLPPSTSCSQPSSPSTTTMSTSGREPVSCQAVRRSRNSSPSSS